MVAAADPSIVPSATSVIDNSKHSSAWVPATSTTYVPLPAVVGNGTIPLKGDDEVLRKTGCINHSRGGGYRFDYPRPSTTTSTAIAAVSGSTATTATPLSPAPPLNF